MTFPEPTPTALWIGTYAGGGGAGLYPLHRNPDGWTISAPHDAAANASFGTYAPRFGLQYLVDEQDGALGVHHFDGAGWTRLAHVPTGGQAPCHVALDHSQSWIAVANYASGSVALYRLDTATGLPIAPPAVHTNTGSGPDADRQQSPHAHWVGFSLDDRRLYATDLGTDQILAFAVDANTGTLGAPTTAFDAPPGSGPRHLLIHARRPRTAYLACELSNALIVLDENDGIFSSRTTLSTLPADWSGHSIVAHIAASATGDRLYVSNRGHDSIAVFALDADGNPTLLQHAPSGGASPRFFLLLEDEHRMIVAHERDHRVTALAILPDGRLAPTDRAITVPGAAFVLAGNL